MGNDLTALWQLVADPRDVRSGKGLSVDHGQLDLIGIERGRRGEDPVQGKTCRNGSGDIMRWHACAPQHRHSSKDFRVGHHSILGGSIHRSPVPCLRVTRSEEDVYRELQEDTGGSVSH